MTRGTLARLVALAIMLLALPLLGVVLAGRSIAGYLEFPPIPAAADHAAFSWVVFLALAIVIIGCVSPFVHRIACAQGAATDTRRVGAGLPWWGWLGALVLATAWLLAWTRFEWFVPFQAYTFSPIWLGYVLLVNALTHRRTGACMLTIRPRRLLALFPLSAAFWWFFEFLNRFVQNWHYVGVPALEPGPYFWQATLAFSTVLPAVLGTHDLLASFPRLDAGLGDAWRIRVVSPRRLAAFALAVAGTLLLAIGIWPEFLYPMVWVAPLVVLTSLQRLAGEHTVFAPLARGDWRELWRVALAALICGLLWEMWNYRSLAHWEYSIPYVHAFELFHMPILGYAGYLPFGVECLAVAYLLDGPRNADAR